MRSQRGQGVEGSVYCGWTIASLCAATAHSFDSCTTARAIYCRYVAPWPMNIYRPLQIGEVFAIAPSQQIVPGNNIRRDLVSVRPTIRINTPARHSLASRPPAVGVYRTNGRTYPPSRVIDAYLIIKCEIQASLTKMGGCLCGGEAASGSLAMASLRT